MRLEVPSIGGTEEKISMCLTGPLKAVFGWHIIRDEYEIKDIGMGNEKFDFLFNKIKKEKTGININSPDWDSLLVIKVTLNLPTLIDNSLSDDANFHLIFGEDYDNRRRKRDVLTYTKNITDEWELPLFASGRLFGTADNAFMIDGARRIAAFTLKGIEKIDAYLIIERKELFSYLEPETISNIDCLRKSISWFPDYQDMPELNIKGQRTMKRYSLFNGSIVKDKTVIDFGCNIGQSCLRHYYNGAKEVMGIDSQGPVVDTANEICKGLKIAEKVKFFKIDFNDLDFDKQIDKIHPEQFDFSTFFSVYRTKELTQRERLFQYIIDKTKSKIFFEGHADKKIDTIDYYKVLFDKFKLQSQFLGYSENDIRPLFEVVKNEI